MSGIIAKLQELYEKEINFEISCFYDNAFEVRLGDPQNGYTLWAKVMRKGDIYFGYIEPGHTEILLEVEEVIL